MVPDLGTKRNYKVIWVPDIGTKKLWVLQAPGLRNKKFWLYLILISFLIRVPVLSPGVTVLVLMKFSIEYFDKNSYRIKNTWFLNSTSKNIRETGTLIPAILQIFQIVVWCNKLKYVVGLRVTLSNFMIFSSTAFTHL